MVLGLWVWAVASALQLTSQEPCWPQACVGSSCSTLVGNVSNSIDVPEPAISGCGVVTRLDMHSVLRMRAGPGPLLAPQLSLNTTLAPVGAVVTMRCLVPGQSPVTHIILCKDGQEAASQAFSPGRFTYDFTRRISGPGDAGSVSCWYQHRSDNNELLNSNLSLSKTLHVTGAQEGDATTSPAGPLDLILGISVPCALLLGLGLLYGVALFWRRPRQTGTGGPGRGTAAGAGSRHGGPGSGGYAEEQLQYATIGQFCTSTMLPPMHYDMVTYATLR